MGIGGYGSAMQTHDRGVTAKLGVGNKSDLIRCNERMGFRLIRSLLRDSSKPCHL